MQALSVAREISSKMAWTWAAAWRDSVTSISVQQTTYNIEMTSKNEPASYGALGMDGENGNNGIFKLNRVVTLLLQPLLSSSRSSTSYRVSLIIIIISLVIL